MCGMDVRRLVVVLIAGSVAAAGAQLSQQAFDVVSIKRNVSGSFPVGPEARQGGSFVATSATLVWIVRFAYDLPDYRVIGGPDWARSARFDVEARAGGDASAEHVKRMVQALLKDRFQLVVRQERREGPVYALVTARSDKRLGPNLRASTGDCSKPVAEERRTPNGGVWTQRTCAPMTELVSNLSNALQAPVEDNTGLTGRWDFEVSYTGERRRNATADAVARDPNDAPVLYTALQEQLGLRLESSRGLVDVLVIESAAQPTEN
jgi:uncharacterized protein (TIGR03435 family)